jgi:hypothetical protein
MADELVLGHTLSEFLFFDMLITTPLLFHTYMSLAPEVCSSPDQTALSHIRGRSFGGFISDPSFVCLKSKKFRHLLHADLLLGLFFYLEFGGGMLLRNVCCLSKDYTDLYSGR